MQLHLVSWYVLLLILMFPVLWFYALHPSPKVPHILPRFHISFCRLVSGPAEKPPPGVRSGVVYHNRLCRDLTFVQALCSAIVIDPPRLFEDTNSYNYVRTPLSYILPISPRKTTGELSFCISLTWDRRYNWSLGNGRISQSQYKSQLESFSSLLWK